MSQLELVERVNHNLLHPYHVLHEKPGKSALYLIYFIAFFVFLSVFLLL